jgi:poly(A) polymerase
MNWNWNKEELDILTQIGETADQLGMEAFVIGGFVRDKIINRPNTDIDIMCIGSGVQLAEAVHHQYYNDCSLAVYKNFGTALVKTNLYDIEFVGARKESYRLDSRKPIVEEGTLEDDINRRDFTINTLAIQINKNKFGTLIDHFNGLADLENGILKTPLEPDITFSDDPLRMLRAIRFATQLHYEIEPTTLAAITRNKERIKIISQERITEELNKIIMCHVPSKGFLLLDNCELLEIIFNDFVKLKGAEYIDGKGHKDNFYHTLQVLDNICNTTTDLWLRWAAILHDIAKPRTKKFEEGHGWTFHGHEVLGSKMVPKIFGQLKLPMNDKMKFVQKLVYLHLRPISLTKENITDAAIRRLLIEAGNDLESLMFLCEADITSKNRQKVLKYLENFELVRKRLKEVEEKDHLRNWQPPITGEIIMKTFGVEPSKIVGDIKFIIREQILEGEIQNNYEAAYKLMIKLGIENGLTVRG